MKLPFFNRRFTPSFGMTLLALMVFMGLSSLGFWQLSRAAEKKAILMQAKMEGLMPYTALTSVELPPKPYQRIKITGHFTTPLFFLDNQHYNHAFGYNVLSPFVTKRRQVLWVDRGFIEGDVTRQSWPLIETDKREQTLYGYAYYPSKKTWFSPTSSLDSEHINGIVIEYIDIHFLSAYVKQKTYPFVLRLLKPKESMLVQEWPLVAMAPSRHVAYAIQWFAMAFVILILYLTLNLKKASS